MLRFERQTIVDRWGEFALRAFVLDWLVQHCFAKLRLCFGGLACAQRAVAVMGMCRALHGLFCEVVLQ